LKNTLSIRRHGDKIEIVGNIYWKFAELSECKKFIAVCQSLKIVLEADSKRKLDVLIEDSTNRVWDYCIQHNIIDEFLEGASWKKSTGNARLDVNRFSSANVINNQNIKVERVSSHDLSLAACG